MKKQVVSLLLIGCLSYGTNGQKLDLDRFVADVNYQRLPQEPVPFEQRTYGVNVKTGGAITNYMTPAALYDKVNLYGWKRVEQSPTVGVEMALEDFVEQGATVESRTTETKDRDGKVTGRTTYYYVMAKYSTRGFAKILGPRTPEVPTAKELEEQKKKEAAITGNRFLKNATINKSATDETTGPVVLNFTNELTYRTQEYTDNKSAVQGFENNKSAIYGRNLRDFVSQSVNALNARINDLYGYVPVTNKELFWIVDAKSEEGATQAEAITAVKTLFSGMKASEPIDELKANLKPLIEYFDSLKTKYASDDKASRKMRYSSFYNLAKIYLLTDEPEKAMKEAEGLIANGYDTRDGENLLDAAKQLTVSFDKAKTHSRHNAPFN
ncbi:hypothetical protein [Spirosoma areae]